MYKDRDPYEQDDAYDTQPDDLSSPQEAYDQPYQQYQPPYGDSYDDQTYYEEPVYDTQNGQPEIVSTSQAINITCTVASLSALAALFLCFADQRSRAVRRFSIQSVGLGIAHIGFGLACWLVDMLLGWVPYIGYWIHILLIGVVIAVSILFFLLRIRMMFHAYRGEAHLLPLIGQSLRRFE